MHEQGNVVHGTYKFVRLRVERVGDKYEGMERRKKRKRRSGLVLGSWGWRNWEERRMENGELRKRSLRTL